MQLYLYVDVECEAKQILHSTADLKLTSLEKVLKFTTVGDISPVATWPYD